MLLCALPALLFCNGYLFPSIYDLISHSECLTRFVFTNNCSLSVAHSCSLEGLLHYITFFCLISMFIIFNVGEQICYREGQQGEAGQPMRATFLPLGMWIFAAVFVSIVCYVMHCF